MRPRSSHLARTLSVLGLLLALLPALSGPASAADELPGPRDLTTIGGYRTIAISFLAPERREDLPEASTYDYDLDGTWRPLAVEPTGGGRLQGTITLDEDERGWVGTLRAGYGGGRFSEPVVFDAFTYGPPEATDAKLFPVDRTVVLTAFNPTSPVSGQDGWRMTAEPARRSLPTRTTRCETPTTCSIKGLRNGVRYEVTYAGYDSFDVDGETKRIEDEAVSEVVVPSRGPRAPRGLEAVPTDGGARLTWTADLWLFSKPVKHVQVRYAGRWHALKASYNPGDNYGPLAYTATLTGLVDGRRYALRVRGLAPGSKVPGAVSRKVVVRP